MGIKRGRRIRLRNGILVLLRRFCPSLMSCRGRRMVMFDRSISMVWYLSLLCDIDRRYVIALEGFWFGFLLP